MENAQENQGIKEIKLLTVGSTGEYELLAWAEKITGLKATKIYDPQDYRMDVIQAKVGYQVVKMLEKKN